MHKAEAAATAAATAEDKRAVVVAWVADQPGAAACTAVSAVSRTAWRPLLKPDSVNGQQSELACGLTRIASSAAVLTSRVAAQLSPARIKGRSATATALRPARLLA
jgi:hypothetical protein